MAVPRKIHEAAQQQLRKSSATLSPRTLAIAPGQRKAPKLTAVTGGAPDKLKELERLREIAYWRCYGFYAERQSDSRVIGETALTRDELNKTIGEMAKSHPGGEDYNRWKQTISRLHTIADDLSRIPEGYYERAEQTQAAFRESWFVFLDADRAVVKASGKTILDGDAFPGIPDALRIGLDDLEELARN